MTFWEKLYEVHQKTFSSDKADDAHLYQSYAYQWQLAEGKVAYWVDPSENVSRFFISAQFYDLQEKLRSFRAVVCI